MFRTSSFNNIPPVIKNLIIINVIMYVLTGVLKGMGISLTGILGMHYFQSDYFRPFQIITHMFMHGGLMHIFFNMFMLWMFGKVLESIWGPKRFFIYYIACGLGAAALHTFVNYLMVQAAGPGVNYNAVSVVVGASGAIYGVLLGYGMLFPNTPMYMYFIPIPVKAKYVIAGMMVFELYLGLQNSAGDNVAHFAHLGGAILGYFLIKYWNKNTSNFY